MKIKYLFLTTAITTSGCVGFYAFSPNVPKTILDDWEASDKTLDYTFVHNLFLSNISTLSSNLNKSFSEYSLFHWAEDMKKNASSEEIKKNLENILDMSADPYSYDPKTLSFKNWTELNWKIDGTKKDIKEQFLKLFNGVFFDNKNTTPLTHIQKFKKYVFEDWKKNEFLFQVQEWKFPFKTTTSLYNPDPTRASFEYPDFELGNKWEQIYTALNTNSTPNTNPPKTELQIISKASLSAEQDMYRSVGLLSMDDSGIYTENSANDQYKTQPLNFFLGTDGYKLTTGQIKDGTLKTKTHIRHSVKWKDYVLFKTKTGFSIAKKSTITTTNITDFDSNKMKEILQKHLEDNFDKLVANYGDREMFHLPNPTSPTTLSLLQHLSDWSEQTKKIQYFSELINKINQTNVDFFKSAKKGISHPLMLTVENLESEKFDYDAPAMKSIYKTIDQKYVVSNLNYKNLFEQIHSNVLNLLTHLQKKTIRQNSILFFDDYVLDQLFNSFLENERILFSVLQSQWLKKNLHPQSTHAPSKLEDLLPKSNSQTTNLIDNLYLIYYAKSYFSLPVEQRMLYGKHAKTSDSIKSKIQYFKEMNEYVYGTFSYDMASKPNVEIYKILHTFNWLLKNKHLITSWMEKKEKNNMFLVWIKYKSTAQGAGTTFQDKLDEYFYTENNNTQSGATPKQTSVNQVHSPVHELVCNNQPTTPPTQDQTEKCGFIGIQYTPNKNIPTNISNLLVGKQTYAHKHLLTSGDKTTISSDDVLSFLQKITRYETLEKYLSYFPELKKEVYLKMSDVEVENDNMEYMKQVIKNILSSNETVKKSIKDEMFQSILTELKDHTTHTVHYRQLAKYDFMQHTTCNPQNNNDVCWLGLSNKATTQLLVYLSTDKEIQDMALNSIPFSSSFERIQIDDFRAARHLSKSWIK